LKIAVNTRLLLKDKLEGIGWFSYETLKRITRDHKEHQFIFLFDRKFDDSFIFSDNIEPVVVHPQARHPVLYYLWFERSLPRVLDKIKPDLFFSPDGYLSLNAKFRSMNVFHDLNFEHYPEDLPLTERKFYRYYFPRYAKKAVRIATVSEFSKRDIINQYKIDAGNIDVVYNGANESFKPVSNDEVNNTRKRYSDGKPYFVFIGALHPRKNLVNLFKAYDYFRKNHDIDIKLLIVGKKKWWTKSIKETYDRMAYQEDVTFIGRLGSVDLCRVLGSALALTYVSYFEGFGIPILEAFRCETPVITSNLTSMPEVAGDAALLVNPFSVSSISDGMATIAKDEALRKELVMKGRKRKELFSWEKSAGLLWKSMEKALNT
jgi:glycosyltransferase involved in cell wall biosynthesis